MMDTADIANGGHAAANSKSKTSAFDPKRPLAIDDIIRLQQQANCSLLNYA